MKVLVVDDEAGKREQIVAFLRDLPGVGAIDEARSFQGAIEKLFSTTYDAVVLDMRLTSFDVSSMDDGGRPRNLGGHEILHKMQRRGLRSRVVVLTQYSLFSDGTNFVSMKDLAADLHRRYPNFSGVIQFQHSNLQWQDRLRALLTGDEDESPNR